MLNIPKKAQGVIFKNALLLKKMAKKNMPIAMLAIAIISFIWANWNYETAISKGITKVQALEIAQNEIDKSNASEGNRYHFVIMKDEIIEGVFGWMFSYVPEKYLETRSVNDLVPGNIPLFVYRDGRAEYKPFGYSPSRSIINLESISFIWKAIRVPFAAMFLAFILLAIGRLWHQ